MLHKISTIFILCLVTAVSLAQNDGGNSPYSRFGVGDQPLPGLIRNRAMGVTGVALFDPTSLNTLNPALLGSNKAVFFEQGLYGEYRSLTSGNATQNNGNVHYDYVYMAFPVIKSPEKFINWTTLFGYSPYSFADYNSVSTMPVAGDTLTSTIEYAGSGALNLFSFSNGFKIGKRFYLGLESAVLFGPAESETITTLEDSGVSTVGFQRLSRSGLKFKAGVVYEDSLFSIRKKAPHVKTNSSGDTLKLKINDKTDKFYFSVGGTYDFGSRLNAENLETIESRNATTGSTLSIDTIRLNESGNVTVPGSFSLGLSIEHRTYGKKSITDYRSDSTNSAKATAFKRMNKKWRHSVDFTYSNWSDYKDFNGASNLFNTIRISYGVEFQRLHLRKNKKDKSKKPLDFQFGVYYAQLPYKINNESLNDIGITFGVLLTKNNRLDLIRGMVSKANLMINIGHRGKSGANFIDEYYINGGLSFTIGNRPGASWFYRRKID